MNILVLTDFSAPSEAGISLALDFVERHQAMVTIFHCLTDETYLDFQLGTERDIKLLDSSNSDAPDWIKRWNEHAKALNASIRLMISGGTLVTSVNTYCKENEVDLIIMGSSGKSQAKAWGSNTEKMVKDSEFPILVVKTKPVQSVFHKIVFASSFTEKEKKSFLLFKDLLPLKEDTEIHLLCIDKESFFSQPTPLIKEVMADFKDLAKPFKAYKHFYQDYNVKAGIRNFTEELSPDLIIMSNKEKKRLKHLLLGNDAVNIAYESRYPVLIMNYPD